MQCFLLTIEITLIHKVVILAYNQMFIQNEEFFSCGQLTMTYDTNKTSQMKKVMLSKANHIVRGERTKTAATSGSKSPAKYEIFEILKTFLKPLQALANLRKHLQTFANLRKLSQTFTNLH